MNSLALEASSTATPRIRLQRVLVGLCVVAIPLTLLRNWQLVWQPLVPLGLLFLSARVVARVQLVAVASLLLLGGAVTTYRVGMAVTDWPSTFEQNMWEYPLSDMLARGLGVTLEHTHRLWASAVGLIAICQVLVAVIRRERRAVVWMSSALLVAISLQGVIGGTRVLENSQHLAFLHGVLAQGVFALVVVVAVITGRDWTRWSSRGSSAGSVKSAAAVIELAGARRAALTTSVLVFLQIVLGAITRHSGAHLPLGLHLGFALVVLAAVALLIGRLGATARELEPDSPGAALLRRRRTWLTAALHTQLLLGVLVTASIFMLSRGFQGEVSTGEAICASLHVLGGAVLLAACVSAWLWSWRLGAPSSAERSNAAPPRVALS